MMESWILFATGCAILCAGPADDYLCLALHEAAMSSLPIWLQVSLAIMLCIGVCGLGYLSFANSRKP